MLRLWYRWRLNWCWSCWCHHSWCQRWHPFQLLLLIQSSMSSSSTGASGGPNPRSSRRRSNLVEASFKAAMSSLDGVQSSKPNAALSCSEVTKVVVAPDRIHACLPTCEGSQLRKRPRTQDPRFFEPRLVQRQNAQGWPGFKSAIFVVLVLRSRARRRCWLQSNWCKVLCASHLTNSAL